MQQSEEATTAQPESPSLGEGSFEEALALATGAASEEPSSEAPDETTEETPAEEPTEVEAESAPAEEEPPVDPAMERSWEAIKREDKRLKSLRDEIKAEREAIAKESTQYRSELDKLRAEMKQRDEEFASDPFKYLEKRGVPFDKLAQRAIDGGKISPEEVIEKKTTSIKSELEQLKAQNKELREMFEAREQERHVNDYRAQISKTLSDERFGLLTAYPNAQQLVLDKAIEYSQQHGRVLTPEESAAIVRDELRASLQQLSSHEAVRSVLGLTGSETPKEQASSGSSKSPQSKPGEGPKTLTNKMSASPSEPEDLEGLTAEQEFERALRIATGGQ